MTGFVRVDDTRVMAELDRLSRLHQVSFQLESLLSRQYQVTQQVVHVDTGSLKGSGDIESSWTGASRWEGVLSYGGPSPGVNNPVEYAVYEQARGDLHDFMAPAYQLAAGYQRIVADHVRGAR